MNLLTKTLAALLILVPFVAGNKAVGQNTKPTDPFNNTYKVHTGLPEEDFDNPFREIYRDTIENVVRGKTYVRDSILDAHRVVTNKFINNWFVFATGGVHTFQGDYSGTSKFKGTLSPDWSVGIGKWFTPGIALKLEFIRSESRGYTEYLTGHYGTGPIKLNSKGIPFREMQTGWWDISGSVILNLTRLFLGYEGYNSPRRMNQFMFAGGFGGVHHMLGKGYGSDNEWAGHIEMQYSRFFSRAKRFSLDLKLRALIYQTNFDLEYGLYDAAANKWDSNLGIDLGFTYYLGKDRPNGWGSTVQQIYRTDFRSRDVLVYREREKITDCERTGTMKTITFFVFYPNNYSGRNDAPIIPNATVNAIDYLAGGIFTQKKFSDNQSAKATIESGSRLHNLRFEDIPTEKATNDFEIDCIQRGYEMSTSIPMSLSMQPASMNIFAQQAGYYYAPIWDGLHEWHYRIDDATLRQQLISSSNYYEQETYGLNAHQGLSVIEDNFTLDDNDMLVSFADVYAAIHGNTGFISQYADPDYVAKIQDILTRGYATIIEAHGVATSQDNYSGENAKAVGIERNTNLAQCRTETVTKWLKNSHDQLHDIKSIVYIDDLSSSGINPVSDPSTRGLAAKLNRCVKVKIQVIY